MRTSSFKNNTNLSFRFLSLLSGRTKTAYGRIFPDENVISHLDCLYSETKTRQSGGRIKRVYFCVNIFEKNLAEKYQVFFLYFFYMHVYNILQTNISAPISRK